MAVIPVRPESIRGAAESLGMADARCSKDRSPRLVRRRDGTRTLETPRPLDSMDAAFEAIAQISLR